MSDLFARWQSLLTALDRPGSTSDAIGQNLLVRWDEPHRHYHTSAHLRSLLDLVEGAPASVLLAVWFHDAIYDPRSNHNEEESVALARRQLARLTLDEDQIEEVSRLVLLTKSHGTTPEDSRGQLLLDADLSILGAPADVYAEYASAIRREYAWVAETAYRAGRAGVLVRFLERPTIYQSEPFRERFERPARANLAREIESLR